MAYFTLLTRYEGRWHPQFGDHDREVVEQERRDVLDSSDPAERILARDTKIVRTATAHQRSIDKAVAALNVNAT